jgi:hypothetical protein
VTSHEIKLARKLSDEPISKSFIGRSVRLARTLPSNLGSDLINILASDIVNISNVLFEYEESEIARQICLLEFQAFSKVTALELMNQALGLSKDPKKSIHVQAMIDNFNFLSSGILDFYFFFFFF